MIDLGKKNVLGILVNAIDYDGAVEKIISAACRKVPFAVSALAVHGVMTGVLDPVHKYRINHFDLITPDGQPVRWALNLLHKARLTDRVYGPELTLRVCERAAKENLSIYLYGSKPAVLEKLVKNLKHKFPGLTIAGSQPSQFKQLNQQEKEAVILGIKASGADIVLVGLGCPRQEVWVFEHRNFLAMPLMAVGAAFDFHAGNLPTAPSYLQRIGMEWFYRLLQEPKRLWRRYLFLNPYYVWLLSLQLINFRKFDPLLYTQPQDELRYG